MPLIPLVLGWLVLVADPAPTAPGAGTIRPSGAVSDLTDLARVARLNDPGVRSEVILFDGARRGLRDAANDWAEVKGPGVVQSLWLEPRPDSGTSRLRVFLDRADQPVLELSLDELAAGTHPRLPRPLVGRFGESVFSFVPMAFRDSLRVEFLGPAPKAARLSLVRLPDRDEVAPFERFQEAERLALDRACALWNGRGASMDSDSERAEYVIDALGGSTQVFLLPSGPRTIRALELEPTAATADAWRTTRLRLSWESDELDPSRAAIDLNVAEAFVRMPGLPEFQSLLVAASDTLWVNRLPMPYRTRATLHLESGRPIAGRIRIRSTPGTAADAGYLCGAALQLGQPAGSPSSARIDARGRALLVGLVLVDESPAGEPFLYERMRLDVDGRQIGPLALALGAPWKARLGGQTGPVIGGFWSDPGAQDGRRQPGMTSYRWLVADPITFERSIAFTAEPGVNGGPSLSKRGVVAFWYSGYPNFGQVDR
jgi:hypothetical protein